MRRQNTITEIMVALILIIGAGTIFLWGAWVQDVMAHRDVIEINNTQNKAAQ